MPIPNSPALQTLYHLDGSSPEFHDRFSDTLYGEEYQRCVPDLRDGDLLWLVDYLDEVCHLIPSTSMTLGNPLLAVPGTVRTVRFQSVGAQVELRTSFPHGFNESSQLASHEEA